MSHTIGQIKQNNQQSNNSSQVDRNSLKPEELARSSMPNLSDADYEFLFNQLLEGIAHGWHDRRIVKFFIRLGDRAKQKDWVAWLERLECRASVLPSQSKRQLGTMMIRLGELTRSIAEVDKIGAVSHRIGKELLFGNIKSVWEYTGPDLPSSDRPQPELSERLPDDFNASSSHRIVEETPEESSELVKEPETIELKPDRQVDADTDELCNGKYMGTKELPATSSNSVEDPNLFSTAESSQLESTARESLETEPYCEDLSEADISASSLSTTAADFNHSNEQKSSQKSAISDELTADLVDFPESIPQSKQTTPNKIFLPEPESDLSSFLEQEELSDEIEASLSNPTSITEAKSDSDRLQEIALSVHTEPDLEAFDISQVINLIQEDKELARQISQKLNSAIAKPQKTIPQLDRSSLELIESWFNLGLKQVSVGEFTKAVASWEKALSINPNLSEAWHNRGSALGRLGDYQAAIESFQNALAIDPENYQAWNDRAHALYQLQNWTEAADSWSNAIKIMPGNHLFWYNRGCALEQLQRWDEAIASHEKALSIMPNFQPGRSRYINLVADSSL